MSSGPPTEASVHREADEHRSFGRVSRVSTKRGRMSDLLYDTVQEKAIEVQKEASPVRVVQEEEPPQPVCSDSEDRGDPEEERQYIQAIMDDQVLDLDADYDDYRILESD